jgi:Holliday junction resolvase RusA-like endonuclease
MGPVRFTVMGDPVPHARPRLGRGGRVYTPGRSNKYKDLVALLVRAAAPAGRDREATFGISADFYRKTAHRCDLDNLLKSVMDGITRAERVWADDSQVREIRARLYLKAAEPKAEIEVYPLS